MVELAVPSQFVSEKMSSHRINLRKPNGEVEEVRPLEGALQWARVHFPDLSQSSEVTRSVSYNLTTHFLNFKNGKEWNDFVRKKCPEDQRKLTNLRKHIKGAGSEMSVHDFYANALEKTTPKVMLNNFELRNFCGLFQNDR